MGFPVAAGGTVNSSDINDLDTRLSNTVEAIAVDTVDTAETVVSSTFTDLATAGPSVTVTCPSAKALVTVSARIANGSASDGGLMSFDVTGASTIAASVGRSLEQRDAAANRASAQVVLETLSTGSNTFTAKYRSSPGSSTSTFSFRSISVFPLGG